MARKNRRSFRGNTRGNAARRKQGAKYNHLKIPTGIPMFEPEADKKYLMDIMPYEVTDKNHPDKGDFEGDVWYKRPYQVHKDVGTGNETIVCPRCFGKSCPICDYRDDLRRNNGDEEEIKATYTKNRNLYSIVPIGDKDFDEKVHLFDFSDYLFQEKFEEQLQDDNRFENFPDLEEGSSLLVRFGEGSFGKWKYAEPTRFDFEDRDSAYDDEMWDELPNLDECFVLLEYDEIKAKFFDVDVEDVKQDVETPAEKEEEEEQEKPARRSPRRKPKPAVEEEPEKEEEEKPVEKPTRRRPARRSAKAEEKPEAKKADGDCPHGHTFGVDNDEHNDCDDCQVWSACYKAKKSA